MRLILSTLIFICTLLLNSAFAEEPPKPTASITSEDLYFCELAEITLKVKFTGTPPFSFQYKVGPATSTSSSTSDYEYSFPFSNIKENTTFELLKVYDANYLPSGDGSTKVSGIINIFIDQKPTIEAGDNADLCGYEYTMDGEITGTTTKVWWSDPGSGADFKDITSPTALFTATTPGTYTLRLNAENRACKDALYDEVQVTLNGRPKGTISEVSDWTFCSSDGAAHNMPLALKFEGNGAFNYTLKNDAGSTKGVFVANEAETTITLPVTETETILFQSIEDSKGCKAENTDMLGQRKALDVKPEAKAGPDHMTPPNCGTTITLEAEPSTGTGQWQTSTTGIDFADITQANTLATVNFKEDEIEKTASLLWTETVTTSDGLACSDSDEVLIKFIKNPTLTIHSITSNEICEDESTSIDLALNGHSPFNVAYEIDGSEKTIAVSTTATVLSFQYPELSREENNTIRFNQIEDNYGCVSNLDLTQDVWVYKMPTANAGPDIDTCGLIVDLLAIQQYDDSEWLYSQGTFDNRLDPGSKFTANNTGTLDLIWQETNGRCTDTDTAKISFFGTPYPVKEITDTVIYASKYIILPADSLLVGTGQWSIIEPAVSGAIFEDPTLYRSKFSNFNLDEYYHLQWKATLASAPEACREKIHNVYIKTNPLFAPTGISPNDDEANDVLKIMGAENISNNKLSVFDKHGKLIVSISNYGEWDQNKGAFKRWPDKKFGYEIPKPGIYLYVFEGDGISTIKNYITVKY